MKILVMGTGGVGGYYGGLLAQQGNEVIFIARGRHLEAIRRDGLQIKSIHGDFKVFPVQAAGEPSQAGPVDLVLFSVKTYDTEQAAQALAPTVGPQTVVLSLQNGIDAAEWIGKVIGMEHVIAGATWLSSAVEAPGVIRQVSRFRRVVLGELDGSLSERIGAIHQVFKDTGITVEVSREILKVLWTKFIFISPVSSFGSLTRLPLGGYRGIPETRDLIGRLMREVEALARAQGIELDREVVPQSLAFMDSAAAEMRASMQLDVQAGRRTELESMVAVIGRRGRELGVATPVADFVYGSLLPLENQAQSRTSGYTKR